MPKIILGLLGHYTNYNNKIGSPLRSGSSIMAATPSNDIPVWFYLQCLFGLGLLWRKLAGLLLQLFKSLMLFATVFTYFRHVHTA